MPLSEAEIFDRAEPAFADPAGAGDNQVVAAPGVGKKIVCVGFAIWNNADTAQTARFRSAANSRTPAIVMGVTAAAKEDYSIPPGHWKVFECNENEALNVNLSAATAVGVIVWFYIAPSTMDV